jgi:hypothetical protein
MELLAVRRARVLALFNVEELNPKGRPLAHDFMRAFVERYGFVRTPQTANEILDPEDKGIVFEGGRLGDVGIEKLTLFSWGVVVDTSASTEASEAVLQDMLDWGATTFDLSNRPSLITRRGYLSELVFTSDMSLLTISPKLQVIGDNVTKLVSGYIGVASQPYEIGALHWFFDSSQSKQLFTPFRIERLADTPFSEKKYYSGAPLKTKDHIGLLGEIEAVLTL